MHRGEITRRRGEPRWVAGLRARFGRRGAMLLVLAVMDVGYGSALVVADRAFYLGQPKWWPASLGGLYGFPVQAWGWVWIGVGLFLLTGVPRRWRGWPQFAAAVVIKVWWAFTAITYATITGYPGVWGPGCIYAGLAVIVLLTAGWEDPP